MPKKKASPKRGLAASNRKIRAQIHKRVRIVVDDFGGVTAFATHNDLIPKYVYKWLSGGMVPSTDNLIKLAKISKVSPDWLLLGKGRTYFDGRKPKPAAKAA